MTFVDCALIAFISLRANWLRSVLSATAVCAGVATVIAMLSIGAGAEEKVLSRIRSIGVNTFLILPAWVARSGVTASGYKVSSLTDLDAVAIERFIDGIDVTAPIVVRQTQIVAQGANWRTVLNGANLGFFAIKDWNLSTGRFFDALEMQDGAQVVLLGSTPAQQLFKDQSPLNQEIRIGHAPFKVVGVMESRGQSIEGRDQDDIVFVPLRSARQRVIGMNPTNADSVDLLFVKVRDRDKIFEIEHAVEELLRDRHGILPDQKSDFSVRHLADVYAAHESSVRTTSFLLTAIASIAVAAGAFGITNVMLASVAERRAEIGLRIAVGARKRDIAFQFLTEAWLIAMMGALPGIAIGAVIALALGAVFDWPVIVNLQSIGLVTTSCLAAGLAAGLLPALRAANLDPIQALEE